jgi:hypothetical protein
VTTGGGGGNGVPGGANTQIQFNNGGVFGGNIALTFDVANSVLSLTGLANVTGNITATDTVTAGNAVTANVISATNGLLLNANTVVASYTIPTGFNAVSGGPITVPPGVVVNSVDGRWTVV